MSVDLNDQSARDEFATAALDYLNEIDTGGAETAVFDPETFKITIGDWQCYLSNAFAEYSQCQTDEERQDVLKRYLQDMRQGDEDLTFEEVQELLRPSLRDRMQIESMEMDFNDWKTLDDLKKIPRGFPMNIIGEHYFCLPAIDHESHMSYVNSVVAEKWNTTFDELFRIAMENLRDISDEIFVEIADGIYASAWHDSYDASRILLLDKVRKECKVKGQHIAFLPNREYVFITGTEDVAGIEMALECCNDVQSMLRPMQMVPLVLVQDEWQVYHPEPAHPCYTDLKLRLIGALDGIYRESQGLIDQKLEDDIFVASYSAFQKPDSNNIFSSCVWVTTSLLPKCEWITFMEPVEGEAEEAKMLGMARWEDVERDLGRKLEPTLNYPPRFFVEPLGEADLKKIKLKPDFPDMDEVAPPAPEVKRDLMDVVREARTRFMNSYLPYVKEHNKQEGGAPEVLLEIPEQSEELVINSIRVDYLQGGEQVVEFRGKSVAVAPTEYITGDGLKVVLKPVAWTQIEFICETLDRTAPKFLAWCNHWFDVNGTFEPDENQLSGVLHTISVPISTDEFTVLAVDFGSAPLEAFESLLKVLFEIGCQNVIVRTPWNYMI